MVDVRERIRFYISNGTIKTEGIRKLEREFKMDKKFLMDLWLEERHKLQPPPREGKINIISEYTWLKMRVKRKDVEVIKEYVKTL